MHLVIANKLYSSWSLRPWLVMHAKGIPFDETVIPLRRKETKAQIAKWSPSGKVPTLIDGDITVWESLAILTYLDEKFPEHKIFPRDAKGRAHALSISHEMHGGFQALRQACPMNLGKRFSQEAWSEDVLANVARIEQIWRDTRARFAPDGPFLFGDLSAADAMYAPIACRLDGYSFDVAPDTRAYMDALFKHPSFQTWREQALEEPWTITDYEEGHTPVEYHHMAQHGL